MSCESVDGYLGHLLLKQDGTILESGGELENDEKTAAALLKVVTGATQGDFGSEVEKISINYAEHSFTVVASNKRLHVIKRSTVDIYD